jgi:hypothetical protein
MEVFITNIYNYITSVQMYTWMLIAVEVVIIGFLFLFPIKKMNDYAKEHIPHIIIGAFLIFAAVQFGADMATQAGFDAGIKR